MFTEQLWILPALVTVLVWHCLAKMPAAEREEYHGFSCEPMFEVTARIAIAAAITIFIWLAYVAAYLWLVNHG